MIVESLNGEAWINRAKVVAVETDGNDVVVMMEGGHGITLVDADFGRVVQDITEER